MADGKRGSYEVAQWEVCDVAVVSRGCRFDDGPIPRLRPADQLLGQPRLADTRIADEGDGLSAAGLGAGEDLPQCGKLRLAPDEHGQALGHASSPWRDGGSTPDQLEDFDRCAQAFDDSGAERPEIEKA